MLCSHELAVANLFPVKDFSFFGFSFVFVVFVALEEDGGDSHDQRVDNLAGEDVRVVHACQVVEAREARAGKEGVPDPVPRSWPLHAYVQAGELTFGDRVIIDASLAKLETLLCNEQL